MLPVDGDRVVAALAVLSKTLDHRGQTYAARGLSAVVTDRALRRSSHGPTLVAAARELIETGPADLGIFTLRRAPAGIPRSRPAGTGSPAPSAAAAPGGAADQRHAGQGDARRVLLTARPPPP